MKQITPVSGNAPRVGETTEAEGQGNKTGGRWLFIAWSKTLVAAMCDFVVFSAMGRVISEQVGAAKRCVEQKARTGAAIVLIILEDTEM